MEAIHVQLGVASGNQGAVSLVKPNFNEIFGSLVEVVGLEVVDDCDVVDPSAILGDAAMSVRLRGFKLLHKFS